VHHADGRHWVLHNPTPYSEEEFALRGITPGDQWHFEVNGKAFYSKGTGVTSFDPFYARINPNAVCWLAESAVKKGQTCKTLFFFLLQHDAVVPYLHLHLEQSRFTPQRLDRDERKGVFDDAVNPRRKQGCERAQDALARIQRSVGSSS
jgi:hypothetical protein